MIIITVLRSVKEKLKRLLLLYLTTVACINILIYSTYVMLYELYMYIKIYTILYKLPSATR